MIFGAILIAVSLISGNTMCKCAKCGKEIDELAVFPGKICVECHAAKFDAEVKRTGRLPKPDFSKTLTRG